MFSLQLPGLISLSAKFVPTVMNLIKKLTEEGQMPAAANNAQRNPSLSTKTQNGVGTSSGMSEVTSSSSSSATKDD